jgi:hypothetical protein
MALVAHFTAAVVEAQEGQLVVHQEIQRRAVLVVRTAVAVAVEPKATPVEMAALAQSVLFGDLAEPSHRQTQGICNA